ncbi:MAG TPA: CBS domain-containing protein [Acidimicrobiales bacterium]|nr:CBS domain-containing protein [Acidimicrobiales bacterium]
MPGPNDPVKSVTAFDLLMADRSSTIRQMAVAMTEKLCGMAIIEQRDGSPAVVSERDLVRALAEGADPDQVWAVDVMTRDVLTIDGDATILAAAELMDVSGVRHLLVTDLENDRTGLVSIRDLLPCLVRGLL